MVLNASVLYVNNNEKWKNHAFGVSLLNVYSSEIVSKGQLAALVLRRVVLPGGNHSLFFG